MIKTSVINDDDVIICQPNPERIAEGLRDTGYNFNTAIADIIDNSIAAKASLVDIRIDMNPAGEITIYIADNGIGMDYEGLKNAMTYGSKVRSDVGSLGKFGLGLKTASTAFCRSLSVISRGDDLQARKAEWDLDYLAEVNDWKLKMPNVTDDELEKLNETAGSGTGTLVIWKKIDRLLKNYSNLKNAKNALNKRISELQFHVALVYQRFLDENDKRASNVNISINGINIKPWDPYAKTEPDTEDLGNEEFPVDIENQEIVDDSEPKISINAFLLPNKDSFSTTEAMKEARISNDMQGFYVYREQRLIHYGDWLNLFINEPHESLLRVEFSFDHRLDAAFNVDIKKSRILPAEEILNFLKNYISPARRAAAEKYRKGVNRTVIKQSDKRDAHAESNRNIDEKAKSVECAKITVTNSDEVQIENQNGVFHHKISIISNPKPGQVRVIPKPDLENGQLWEPCIADGKHAVQINQSHPYYKKIYYPVLSQHVMVTGMDALLWALAEAEYSTFNEEVKEVYEEIRINVSRILKRLVADLPDPDESDEE